jgi:hypothetical protein
MGKQLGNYQRITEPSSAPPLGRAEAVRPAIAETAHLSTPEANDPMEGYEDVFWSSDRIAGSSYLSSTASAGWKRYRYGIIDQAFGRTSAAGRCWSSLRRQKGWHATSILFSQRPGRSEITLTLATG